MKKRGPRIILTLDDRTGRIEVNLFDDVFQKHRDLIVKDALVLVDGMLRFDEFSDSWRLSARRLTELDKVREQQARPPGPEVAPGTGTPRCSWAVWRKC